MDVSSITRTDSFKNFVTVALPGFIALWPFLYLIIQYQYIDFAKFYILIFVITTIAATGLGIVIEDIGSRLENLIAYNRINEKKEVIDYYWRSYLLLQVEQNNHPVIFTYIRSLVIRLKAELGLFVSLLIMLVGQSFVEFSKHPLFKCNCNFIIYIFFILFLLIFLFLEFKKTINTLHKCRKLLIDYTDSNKNILSIGDNYINENITKAFK